MGRRLCHRYLVTEPPPALEDTPLDQLPTRAFVPYPWSLSPPPHFHTTEASRRRVQWRESEEGQAARRASTSMWVLVGVLAVTTIVGTQWLKGALPSAQQIFPPMEFFALIAVIYLVVCAGFFHKWIVARHMRDLDDRRKLERLQESEADLVSGGLRGDFEFANLWALTQKRLDLYHEIATRQSARSFHASQGVMVAGFAALLILGTIASMSPNGTASIAVGGVAVAGGAMSAFLSATFLKSQTASSAQLQQFFSQPVELTRVLSAERLVSQLDDPVQRATAIQTVVAGIMETGRHPM